MDSNKLEKQKDYIRIWFGDPQVLTYIGSEVESLETRFLFWARGKRYQGHRFTHSFSSKGVEDQIQELSDPFKKFILLFQ